MIKFCSTDDRALEVATCSARAADSLQHASARRGVGRRSMCGAPGARDIARCCPDDTAKINCLIISQLNYFVGLLRKKGRAMPTTT